MQNQQRKERKRKQSSRLLYKWTSSHTPMVRFYENDR